MLGFINSSVNRLSSLKNDMKFASVKEYEFSYANIAENTPIGLNDLIASDKVYRIMLVSKSVVLSSEIIHFKIEKRSSTNTITESHPLFIDLHEGVSVLSQRIEINEGDTLHIICDESSFMIDILRSYLAQFKLLVFTVSESN